MDAGRGACGTRDSSPSLTIKSRGWYATGTHHSPADGCLSPRLLLASAAVEV
jgi:hypothetical protein